MCEVYAVIYVWIKKADLSDVDGLCEEDDVVNFRLSIIASLRIVRVQHTQEIIARFYAKLDSVPIIMWPGGMATFFTKQNKISLELKKYNEDVSEPYLLHRTYKTIKDKHVKLSDAITKMRQVADSSGVPTSFLHAKDNLIDTFAFEVPDEDKTEKLTQHVRANFAGNEDSNNQR